MAIWGESECWKSQALMEFGGAAGENSGEIVIRVINMAS